MVRPLLYCPDGDGCGCIAAICGFLQALGKKVQPLLLSEVPEWYEFLFAEPPEILGNNITIQQLKEGKQDDFDLIIIVDTNSYNQLPGFDEYLRENSKPVLVIDHHITNDGLGDVELIDIEAAAAGLIVFDLIKYAGWSITESVAQALFVAISTDTGWFRFSNTDSRAIRTSAELVDVGVIPTKIYHDLHENFSPARFKLRTLMLNTLELHLDDRYASQYLLQSDFEKTSASHKDTENLIDECQRIKTVEAAAFFVKLMDNRIKISLRSKGSVDVRKIAQEFGGGGHKMASGLHMDGSLQNAENIILERMKKQFAKIDRETQRDNLKIEKSTKKS